MVPGSTPEQNANKVKTYITLRRSLLIGWLVGTEKKDVNEASHLFKSCEAICATRLYKKFHIARRNLSPHSDEEDEDITSFYSAGS